MPHQPGQPSAEAYPSSEVMKSTTSSGTCVPPSHTGHSAPGWPPAKPASARSSALIAGNTPRRRHCATRGGRWLDTVVYALLADEGARARPVTVEIERVIPAPLCCQPAVIAGFLFEVFRGRGV